MAENKNLKFQFAVDQASVQAVNRALDGMIAKATQLAKVLKDAGGLLGGGSVGAGSPSPQRTMASAGAGGGGSAAPGKIGFSLPNILPQAAQQISHIQQLTNSIRQLGVAQAQASREWLPGVPYPGAQGGASLGAGPGAWGAAPPGPPPSWASRASAFMGPQLAQTGFGGSIVGGINTAEMMGARGAALIGGLGVGGTLAMGAGLAGGYLGGYSAYKYGKFSMAESIDRQRLLNDPFIENQDRMAAKAQRVRSGDYGELYAMQRIQADPEKAQALAETLDPRSRKGIVGSIGGYLRWNWNRGTALREAFAAGPKEAWNELTFDDSNAAYYQKGLKRRTDEATSYEERLETPFEKSVRQEAVQNVSSKMSMMRALGVGNGRRTPKGAKDSIYTSASELLLLAYNQFDPGEVASAIQGISGQGSRGAALGDRRELLSTVLQAQAAGIQGAAGIGGIMSRQGKEAGTGFIDLLRTLSGSGAQGGVDVSVAGLLGNYVSQQAAQFNMPGFGGAGVLGAVSAGVGGDMAAMVARQNIMGMGGISEVYKGSRDPAQQAFNFLAAVKAAPNAGYYAQQYLSQGLTAERIAEVRSGRTDLTDQETGLGLTIPEILSAATEMDKSLAFRAMPKGFKEGSLAQKLSIAMQSGADPKAYLDSLPGLTKKQKTNALATVISVGNINKPFGDTTGEANVRLYGMGRKITKGAMAGDVAGASLERVEAQADADKKKMEVDKKDEMETSRSISAASKASVDSHKRLVVNATNLAADAEALIPIMSTFAKAIKSLLGGNAGNPNTKTTPKP